MSFWRQLTYGLRALMNRKATDQDLNDETEEYLGEAITALVARGAAPEEAERVARLEFGNLTSVREEVRSYGWENVPETVLSDLRLAGRRLRNDAGFTVVSAFTLALGIGSSTAIFSAVKPILFEPLPYPNSNRLVMIWDVDKGERSDVTFHTYREVLARSRSLEGLAVADRTPWAPTLTGGSQPERLNGQRVSASYFRVLKVPASIGRDFEAAEDRPHGPKVAVLSDSLWERRFHRDPAVIGREIRLDDDLWTVIGVMPARFDNVLAPTAEIWAPMQYDTEHITQLDTAEWGHHLKLLGRLQPGLSKERAKRELDRIAQQPIRDFPRPEWASLASGLLVDRLKDQVTRGVKPALGAVSGAVVLVLLITCVNVTNLLAARGAQRRSELAMRAALGANKTRLLIQLLSESLLLAGIGGALALLVAEFGIWLFVSLSPPGLPRVNGIELDGGVFTFALGLTAVIGILIGLIPAFDAARVDLVPGIQQNSPRIAGGHQATRRVLVIGEVVLAMVVLVSTGLLLHSLQRLFSIEPGFDASHLLTMEISISGHRYDEATARQRFFAQVLEAVRRVPGVASAAISSLMPFSGGPYDTYGVEFENERSYDIYRYVISPSYFQTMHVPLLRGRLLNDYDTDRTQQVAVISESLAKRQFGDTDPIGKRAHVGPLNRPWYVVVGVVGNVKQASLAEDQAIAVYITPKQSWFADDSESVIVRARGSAMGLAAAVKNAIWSIDKDEAIVGVTTMEGLLAKSAAERHFAMTVFEGFGFAALLLAAMGLYGVLAGSVQERVREIGIRAAVGASRGDILGIVLGQGFKLAGLGIAIGLLVAPAITRGLASLLFDISRLDPITYLGVIVLLGGVAALASCVPAWRAARIDPAITLRVE